MCSANLLSLKFITATIIGTGNWKEITLFEGNLSFCTFAEYHSSHTHFPCTGIEPFAD